jgi:DNA-binding transcriptional LysR family regulator
VRTALEKAVGATLILRGGREFLLTPEGKSAVAAAEAIEAAVSSARSAIRAAKQGVEGLVKVLGCSGCYAADCRNGEQVSGTKD